MHDIDRVLFEQQEEVYGQQEEEFGTYGETGQYETYGETNQSETYGEIGMHEEEEQEEIFAGETAYGETASESVLASEFLEVTTEEELDRFLSNLIGSAVSAAKSFAQSDAGRAVGGVLKSAAKQVLPQIGQAVGGYLAPGVGAQAGRDFGNWLGNKLELGLEIEGLSREDRQFETAKAFVRFAGDTARTAAKAPVTVSPTVAARNAALASAKRNLPGLVMVAPSRARRPKSGRWVRRGSNIIIIGA